MYNNIRSLLNALIIYQREIAFRPASFVYSSVIRVKIVNLCYANSLLHYLK